MASVFPDQDLAREGERRRSKSAGLGALALALLLGGVAGWFLRANVQPPAVTWVGSVDGVVSLADYSGSAGCLRAPDGADTCGPLVAPDMPTPVVGNSYHADLVILHSPDGSSTGPLLLLSDPAPAAD